EHSDVMTARLPSQGRGMFLGAIPIAIVLLLVHPLGNQSEEKIGAHPASLAHTRPAHAAVMTWKRPRPESGRTGPAAPLVALVSAGLTAAGAVGRRIRINEDDSLTFPIPQRGAARECRRRGRRRRPFVEGCKESSAGRGRGSIQSSKPRTLGVS